MCCCSLGGFITSGPDQVMVVSGWGYTEVGFQIDGLSLVDQSQDHQFKNLEKSMLIKGGGRAWVIPCVQRADFLPMNIFQILVTSPDVPTINGVKISVQGVAQVKIGSDDQFLRYYRTVWPAPNNIPTGL